MMNRAVRTVARLSTRQLSSKPPKKGKKGEDAAAPVEKPAAPGTLPLNYLKDGEDPKILPTDQYPAWLWSLDVPTLNDLERKGYGSLTLKEERRYWRLKTVRKIKEQNMDTSF